MTKSAQCPSCGEELSEGITFCESCGAKIDSKQDPTGVDQAVPTETPSSDDGPSSSEGENTVRRWSGDKRVLIGAAAVLLFMVASFAGGYFLADDSQRVSTLESELASTEERAGEVESTNAELTGELEAAEEENAELARKLKAERSISGNLPSPDESIDVSANADYVLGEAGIVGPTVMRPTSLEEAGSGGGGVKYTLLVDVKNDGDQPINPFCGGEEATIVDRVGREYSGDSALDLDTPNCGDDIQPGLTKSGYEMEFTLPANAEPALIELVYDPFGGEDPITWAVE